MPSTQDKDKPWDTEDVDKWKIDPFTPADNLAGAFAEESSFVTLFPKYRENHLRQLWPLITKALAVHHIACQLDLIQGSMTVRTTLKTYDPAAILNARDLIRLLARSVPAPQAIKVLEDGVACDIIKIRGLVRNKEKFVKRRQRILGPDGSTLKALELLTNTYILVQGNTVATMGPYKGLKQIRRIIEDVFMNFHPIYHIKEMMIKRELEKDPELKQENWDRFLPNYKKKALNKRKTPFKVTDKTNKKYTPFPPPREKSKIDLQIESGEYFLAKREKERKSKEEREERQGDKAREKKIRLEKEYLPPKEDQDGDVEGEKKKKKKKRRREEEEEEEEEEAAENGGGEREQDEDEKPRKKKKKSKSETTLEGDVNGEASEKSVKKKKRKKERESEVDEDATVKKEKRKMRKVRENADAVEGDTNGM